MRAWFLPAFVGAMSASLVSFPARGSPASAMSCQGTETLEDLVSCIRSHMPGSQSGVFVAPTSAEREAFRKVTRAMLAGGCDSVVSPALSSLVEVRPFLDHSSGRVYCVMLEVLDAAGDGIVDRGFGTFIVDPSAEREVVHEAPHPIADAGTELQAVTVFKWTRSRSYLLAGTHRNAITGERSCTGQGSPSDVAHDAGNLFHATNAMLAEHYGDARFWVLQWHGMAARTCSYSDVHLSSGLDERHARRLSLSNLRRALLREHPGWRITMAGASTCGLDATENVEGRWLNGVPPDEVCDAAAAVSTERFIHIEQDPAFRDASDWIDAIRVTFPSRS